ncbi:carboxypeptidase-like regulatory domain-containing protein [Flavobacterium sp. SUN046]|uniref:carboxypeptidase-like regulatory domain-containing protein n=1 Tax=Flavobacterium sp. SUN046 TaxID=3002440 RepID=UPI002DBC00CC|nr:carboxypeptidase-like regulatory domain-containing protein [Flavobacterium sp. SUN046]MEC4048330.1 carboxypeptidase-like regulatory domain-containing protein [Flavobacterium sp. SUN046]
MKKNQSQTLKMFLSTQKYLSKTDQQILDSLIGFRDYLDEFNETNVILESHFLTQSPIFGILEKKKNARIELLKVGIDINNNLYNYLLSSKSGLLHNTYLFNEDKCTHLSDNDCLYFFTETFKKAFDLSDELAKHGINKTSLVQFAQAIAKFKHLAEAENNKKAASEIVDLFMANTRILAKMDVLVLTLKKTHTDFVNGYFKNRHIDKAPKLPLGIRFTVVDSSGAPIAEATIENKILEINRKTTGKGNLIIQKIDDGEHQFTFSKKEYQTKTITVSTKTGTRSDIEVILEFESN